MKTHTWNNLSATEQQLQLARPASSQLYSIQEKTQKIIDRVKAEGDSALIALTATHDQVALAQLAITASEFTTAKNQISSKAQAALKSAFQQITTYHQAQQPGIHKIETAPGIYCERLPRAIDRVGLYVPGGSAPLISTLLMLAIPAQLAGCPLRILCTPPNKAGTIDPHLLAAAELCDIQQIYKVGGAQAIAAMAYGTQSIPKVDKIFGPGNAWVTAAKMLVSQDANGASIDMPAGPSELLVIADSHANPEFVAADLLSQAEHGPDSQVLLLTPSAELAAQVNNELRQQLPHLLRCAIAEQALEHGRIIIVPTLDQAFIISNTYAPEHLSLQVANPENYLPHISNVGAVFMGTWSAEAMGDYITGSNHVLPTSGFARACSGLSLVDFMKFISVQKVTESALHKLGPFVEHLAELEGLGAHKNAVSIRLAAIDQVLNK